MAFSRLNPFTPKGEDTFTPEGDENTTTLSEFVECKVLTGRVLSKYAELTGIDTELALQTRHDSLIADERKAWDERNMGLPPEEMREFKEPVFIGLVVGNWIRISDVGRHPILLALQHDQHRHVEFKEKVIEICTELYVISPLGKLFVGKSRADVERGLRMIGGGKYREVPIPPGKEKAVKLVSSTRPDGSLLAKHAYRVSTFGEEVDEDIRKRFIAEGNVEKVPSLLFPFTDMPESLSEQKDMEFPHPETWDRPQFMREFFSVDPAQR
jgi:hypothetical protein